ncbi:hypothetical protein JP0475_09340 [Helicobacter pylori]
MNETLKQFKENQKRNQENLNKLLDFVKTGEKYGIEIEESFKKKINSLNNLISLSEKEREGLSIVAVVANPFGWGLEYWLKHKEEFQKLSHIKTLQDATQKKIKENGGKLTIIEEAKKASSKMLFIGKCPWQKKSNKILRENWNI